tara:strand:- start:669 stop:812 length:144 start_codon:yes stop_codon:yes gene_type:complete
MVDLQAVGVRFLGVPRRGINVVWNGHVHRIGKPASPDPANGVEEFAL